MRRGGQDAGCRRERNRGHAHGPGGPSLDRRDGVRERRQRVPGDDRAEPRPVADMLEQAGEGVNAGLLCRGKGNGKSQDHRERAIRRARPASYGHDRANVSQQQREAQPDAAT
jgi:hypothetical protein